MAESKVKITAHTLVKNEENFLWYSVKSVIDYVDEMLLWDTGSTDKTIEIIKLLQEEYPQKIKAKFFNQRDINHYTELSQMMLDETDSNWVILVDGDEVWWRSSIKVLVETIINSQDAETIVSRYVNCIGDIYHFIDEKKGKYKIDNTTGNITIRAMNMKIPGLHYDKPHGQRGLYDESKVLIQERNISKRIHLNELAYLHTTHLVRSSKEFDVAKRQMKYKFSKGIIFPKDFYLPESFFYKKPNIVPNIWIKRNLNYEIKAYVYDLLRIVKRVLPINETSGY